MNCIKRYITLSVFAALPLLTGCIYQTLEPCPPVVTGRLWIEPSFTMHNYTDTDGHYKELFTETASRIDLFYFDAATGLLKAGVVDQEIPANGKYRIPVELPAGQYKALAWANLYGNDATSISPQALQIGVTHWDEMLVRLSEAANHHILLHPTPLLWGKTDIFTVDPAGYEHDSVIPADFIRDTNIVDCYIRWRNKDTKKLCPLWMHADSTRIYIDAANSTYELKDNDLVPTDSIIYIPTYQTGPLATIPTTEVVPGNAAILEASFTLMRLLTDRDPVLRITRLRPDGREQEVYRKGLMKDFISHFYKTQESLDREERFVIELEFECEHKGEPDPGPGPNPDPDPDPNPDPDPSPQPPQKPWVAVTIIINGWTLVDNGDLIIGQ